MSNAPLPTIKLISGCFFLDNYADALVTVLLRYIPRVGAHEGRPKPTPSGGGGGGEQP